MATHVGDREDVVCEDAGTDDVGDGETDEYRSEGRICRGDVANEGNEGYYYATTTEGGVYVLRGL